MAILQGVERAVAMDSEWERARSIMVRDTARMACGRFLAEEFFFLFFFLEGRVPRSSSDHVLTSLLSTNFLIETFFVLVKKMPSKPQNTHKTESKYFSLSLSLSL